MGFTIVNRCICPHIHVIIKVMPKGTIFLIYCIKDKDYWFLTTGKICNQCKEKIILNE